MRTNSRSGGRALVWAVLTLVVSLSQRVQAQQSGLFPLAPIRRERPPCQNEDPVYKYYKQQYFGYHPTYWRRFPTGWGVPSQEAPDKEKAYHDNPLGNPPERGEGGPGPGAEGMGPPPGGGRMPIPNVPQERSPFEMENGQPGVNPLPRGNPAPQPAPGRTGRSPFDDLPQGAAVPSRRSPRARTAVPSPGDDTPELTAPAAQPEQDSAARSTGGGADDDTVARGNDGPLLAIDDIDVPRSANVGSLFDSDPIQPPAPASAPNSTSPTQPPPRRGFISSLFGGLGTNWFRR
jgi:hypothetical protein